MLRSRVPVAGHDRATARSGVPRTGLGRCGRCCQSRPHHGHPGHRARDRPRPADHRLRDQSRRHGCGVAGQGTDRPGGRGHLSCARERTSRLHGGAADLRCGDLPRRLALSRDGAMGRAARCAGRVSPTRACRRTRELSPHHVRRSRQHVPRESHPVPRGGEHVLCRVGELRERRVRHDIGDRAPGRNAAVLSAVRAGGPARGGSGSEHRHRTARVALPDVGRCRRAKEPARSFRARRSPSPPRAPWPHRRAETPCQSPDSVLRFPGPRRCPRESLRGDHAWR